jgi:hypothetical protein
MRRTNCPRGEGRARSGLNVNGGAGNIDEAILFGSESVNGCNLVATWTHKAVPSAASGLLCAVVGTNADGGEGGAFNADEAGSRASDTKQTSDAANRRAVALFPRGSERYTLESAKGTYADGLVAAVEGTRIARIRTGPLLRASV